MRELLFIFIGGGAGSICRYAIGSYLLKGVTHQFPWATLLANALGCLCIGLLMGYFERRNTGLIYLLLVTGFCGGFTTFSTFSNETFQLFRQGLYVLAFTYAAASLLIGLFCLGCGFMITKN